MNTFGQAIVSARKIAGLTTNRSPPILGAQMDLNDLEHDRYQPPENKLIEQLAEILNVSSRRSVFLCAALAGERRRRFR